MVGELGLAGAGALELAGSLPPRPPPPIVGSRAAHRRCLELVPGLVAAAAAAGFGVISGGAIGIDGAAHRAALAAGVRQLAVVPSAPERPYPAAHAPLFAAIARAEGSGVLFTLRPGQSAGRQVFASRNRVVVGLCDALVVVEAARASGSLGSGRLALRAGLRVAAVLGSAGAGSLIADGAAAIAGDDAATAAAGLERWLRGADPGGPGWARWPAELRWLAAALRRAGTAGVSVDGLEAGTEGIPAASGSILLALLEAEALGLVVEVEIGRYREVGG